MAYLSVLCVLCGKESLPRFMAENGGLCRSIADTGWRIMAVFVAVWRTNILYFHPPFFDFAVKISMIERAEAGIAFERDRPVPGCQNAGAKSVWVRALRLAAHADDLVPVRRVISTAGRRLCPHPNCHHHWLWHGGSVGAWLDRLDFSAR